MIIIYDGDCPFCSNFVQMMVLKRAVGDVELVDARSGDPRVADVLSRGYDLDEGMVVLFGQAVYYGADAVSLISSLSADKGWVATRLSRLLSDPARAQALYPWMKFGRRLTLNLLGRPRIEGPHPLAGEGDRGGA